MKQVKIFLVVFLAFLLLSIQVKAQTSFTTFRADLTHFYAQFPSTKVDSLSTIYSDWFTLAGYDDASSFAVYSTYKLSSVKGKPRILAIVQGSNNVDDATSYTAVDSLTANADSVETYQYNAIDFNGKKFLKYRLKITGTAGNRSDTYFQAEFYLPRKKF